MKGNRIEKIPGEDPLFEAMAMAKPPSGLPLGMGLNDHLI
jgi:hypothetical protein